MRCRSLLAAAALLLRAPVALPAQESGPPEVADELRWRVERLRATGSLRIGEEVILDRALTLAAYESRGYRAVWNDESATSLRRAIADAWDDGLEPEAYHLSTMRRLEYVRGDPALRAELDLLSTDALVRLGHDLRFGRAEPRWPTIDSAEGWPTGDASHVDELVEVVRSGRVREALDELRPTHFAYTGLARGLAELRRVRMLGGWQPIPDGTTIRPDSVDDRVPVLRARLALAGDLDGATSDDASGLYDRELQAAVRSFQRRHGLNEDGLVGGATLAALNVPVEQRIDQLRINLERLRWMGHTLPDTFVLVSIPGARVRLIRGRSVAFETRAVVGRKDDATPVFAAQMQYVDLNPTWTVPSGIVDEVIGLQRRDPLYFARQRMRLLDAFGREVDPFGVDFASYTAADFPYVIRQDPGPRNALGRLKLMLPNPYHVYLHDTPERALFARERRLFSHGCVRIEDPVGLAELVLDEPESWNRETLGAAIAEGLTRTLVLPRPVPVFVVYWTAESDPSGALRFYPDVYGRDPAALRELDSHAGSGTRAVDSR